MEEANNRERNRVFNRVRSALAPLRSSKHEREEPPAWDDDLATCKAHPQFESNWDLFAYRFEALHGVPLKGWEALQAFLEKHGCQRGYCDPALIHNLAHAPFKLSTQFDPAKVDDYEFGITQAAGVIAETGSVMMTDKKTSSRLGAVAPWIHIAVVEGRHVLPSMLSAIDHFERDPYIVFATGPSKTADVEGILIEGVHGPGIQAACLI